MENKLKIAALFLVSTLPMVGAQAQHLTMKVSVPFAFHVNNATLPAGTYTVSKRSPGHFVAISRLDAKGNVETLGLDDTYNKTKPATMVFHRIGNQYFLHEIVGADASDAIYFVPTKAEKLAKQHVEVAGLTYDPVLLAMN